MQQVYMIIAGRLPDKIRHPFKRRRSERLLENTPGLIDWCVEDNGGMLLFFGTRTHAEKFTGAVKKGVDPQIWLAEADYQTHTFHIKGPIEDQEP